MITAKNITDEQIRELKLRAMVRFERGVDIEEDREIYKLAEEASVPHMLLPMLSHEDYMATMSARACCAEILNARAASKAGAK